MSYNFEFVVSNTPTIGEVTAGKKSIVSSVSVA